MILIALIKSVFDFLWNVLWKIYFRIRALTKHLTNETEEYNDSILFQFSTNNKGSLSIRSSLWATGEEILALSLFAPLFPLLTQKRLILKL